MEARTCAGFVPTCVAVVQWSELDSGDDTGTTLIPTVNSRTLPTPRFRARPLLNALLDALSTSLVYSVVGRSPIAMTSSAASGASSGEAIRSRLSLTCAALHVGACLADLNRCRRSGLSSQQFPCPSSSTMSTPRCGAPKCGGDSGPTGCRRPGAGRHRPGRDGVARDACRAATPGPRGREAGLGDGFMGE
jgi:hypothetical protein